jgi:hypothetical protein
LEEEYLTAIYVSIYADYMEEDFEDDPVGTRLRLRKLVENYYDEEEEERKYDGPPSPEEEESLQEVSSVVFSMVDSKVWHWQ